MQPLKQQPRGLPHRHYSPSCRQRGFSEVGRSNEVVRWSGRHPLVLRSKRGSPTASKAMVKLAALLSTVLGLGFGLPCAYGIWYLSTSGEVWTFLGFPTYGEGPFEGIGIRTTVPLLVAFLVVCVLEVVTGGLLWRGLRRAGAILAVVLLPFELAFWIGFALPFGPPLGLARVVLVTMKWFSFARPSN
jgi:hypothetical protein